MTDDVFAFWTHGAVLAAIISGIAMALVVDHLTRNVRPSLTTLLVVTLGVLWYLPQVIHRAIDPAAPAGSAARTVGTFLLFLGGFALPMGVTLHLLHWRHRT